jgi:thymidylate synthase
MWMLGFLIRKKVIKLFNYDTLYNSLAKKIIEKGKWDKDQSVRTQWADGSLAYTKSILNVQIKFDNSSEIAPLLTTKQVPIKDPIKELFWIWRDKSNKVDDLRKMGCNVWNEWEREDGTIGKAYGWQLANKYRRVTINSALKQMMQNEELKSVLISGDYAFLDQVDYLLYMLKYNPYSRRIKTTLWCVEDLDEMALEPCVYETHWQLWDGKLHLTVNVRSNDMGLGTCYNVYQYSVLHKLIAQVTGHNVGSICFNIDNLHLYDRHIPFIEDQIKRQPYEPPRIWINPEIKSFYDFNINDIKVINYKHHEKIQLEVAI